tara:strand:+ start:102 stop:290 length:189 start_codon:yes stop_codon:yes gene_type:complete
MDDPVANLGKVPAPPEDKGVDPEFSKAAKVTIKGKDGKAVTWRNVQMFGGSTIAIDDPDLIS